MHFFQPAHQDFFNPNLPKAKVEKASSIPSVCESQRSQSSSEDEKINRGPFVTAAQKHVCIPINYYYHKYNFYFQYYCTTTATKAPQLRQPQLYLMILYYYLDIM